MSDLISRIEAHDPELAEETAHALESARLKGRIDRAEANLQEACYASTWDPTGQDTEDAANAAAADLIAARDDLDRHEDPIGFMERQMGA